MGASFDADAFGKRKLTLNGADYYFRPATIKDEIDYLTPYVRPKLSEIKDSQERINLMIEVIQKYVEGILVEDLYDVTSAQLFAIFYYVLNGIPPENEGKNS